MINWKMNNTFFLEINLTLIEYAINEFLQLCNCKANNKPFMPIIYHVDSMVINLASPCTLSLLNF